MSRLRQLTASPKTLQADELAAQARQALAAGRRHEARHWVWEALQADPENVTAWLMLAALASPEASLRYVQRALELRPHNPLALRALEWAEGRLGASLKTQDAGHSPQGAAETVVHAPAVPVAEAQPSAPAALEATLADVGPLEAAPVAATLLHVPAIPKAEPAEAGEQSPQTAAAATVANLKLQAPPEEPPASEATRLHTPAALVEPASAEATLLHVPAAAASEAEAPAPAAVEATVAEVVPGGEEALGREPEPEPPDEITGRHATIPILPESGEDKLSDTSPHKAAGRAALTLLGLALVVAVGVLAALAFGGRTQDPARPAAVAAIPVGHFLKSTLRPAATDTPTVTPSPTWTPTFTPTPSITPTPTATDTPTPEPTLPPYEAWAGAGEGRWIDVNLTLQSLTAMEGQQPVQSFLVSTGLWNTPTVTGDYHVYVKYVAADMSGPGYFLPQVPYVMYFYRDYGIHGTYWHNNFGHPMSHGCVNMRTEEAGWLFDWASIGTLVHVHE